jgi:lysophospholipase L1-like esterase
MQRNLASNFFLLGVSLVCVELLAYGAGKFLTDHNLFYSPPDLSKYESYINGRHKTLGWPSYETLAKRTDSSGSRPCVAFPEIGNSCVALFGDSFTWSVPVDDEHAWGNVLAKLIGCRVSNYGYGAYGTDQAEIRFEETNDSASIVILNHFTGDIRRNVNQLRNLIQVSNEFGLKPRYDLINGRLQLLPLPALSRKDAQILVSQPEQIVNDEFFLPDGLAGIQKLKFPYSFSLIKLFNHEHIKATLQGESVWGPYYNPTHPSKGLQITEAIITRFVSIAKEREKTPVITMIPNASDIREFKATGRWVYQPLVDLLKHDGIEPFEFGPGLIKAFEGRNICDFMQDPCDGHFNEKGYAILAELMKDYLYEKQVLKNQK